MGSIKEINIKKRAYYFYNDIIDIETFDSKNLKLDKKRTKILIFTILDTVQLKQLVVCSCHITYAFQSESTLYVCLNVKELLARSRREI